MCLRCAVPVRGQVLCTACAARAVGEPAPLVPKRRTTRIPESVAATLLGLALIATIPSWDRFGTPLSPWRPSVSSWRLAGAVALLLAFVAASLSAWRGPSRPTFAAAVAFTALSSVAAVAIGWQLYGSPDFVAHTAVPYAVIALSTAAAVVGAVRLRRLR